MIAAAVGLKGERPVIAREYDDPAAGVARRQEHNADSVAHVVSVRNLTKSNRMILWFLIGRLRGKDEWRQYVSVPQHVIAAKLGIDRRTVIRGMVALESAGYLSRKHQPKPEGGRKPDLIVLNRSAVSASVGAKCHIRKTSKCHIRSTSLPVVKDPFETASVSTGGTSMQGELFANRRNSGKKKPTPIVDNAKSRLQTFQKAYRAKYGRAALIPNLAIVMALVKRWQVSAIPDAAVWVALVDCYLRQDDGAVVAAAHPITWLSRRIPALLPSAQRQAAATALAEQIEAKNAADAAKMTDLDRLRIRYPGIRDGETVEAYTERRKANQARRRAGEEARRRWA